MSVKVYGFSLHAENVDKIDRVRGAIPRSAVVDACLAYLTEDYIKSLADQKRVASPSYEEYQKQNPPQVQVTPQPTSEQESKTQVIPTQEAIEKSEEERKRVEEDQKIASEHPLEVPGHTVLEF